jgi:hypothetical protein
MAATSGTARGAIARKPTYEYHSDDDENDENWPMWSRVYDPRAREFYFYNNFDGSCADPVPPPDDYVAPDAAHERAAPPSHAEWLRLGHARRGASVVELYHDPFLKDLPKPMARLIAAQRIENMARARQGRKRARAKKAGLAFALIEQQQQQQQQQQGEKKDDTAALLTSAAAFAHSKGWVFVPLGILRYPDGLRHPFWHHVAGNVTAWSKPTELLEGELRLERLAEEKAQQDAQTSKAAVAAATRAEREARRRQHKAMMAQGAADLQEKVSATEARRSFKAEQRAKRKAAHAKMMASSFEDIHEDHEVKVEERRVKDEAQERERAARKLVHQAKMEEMQRAQELRAQEEKVHEHEDLEADLDHRAGCMLEAQGAPWTLAVGVKRATGIRAADWAMGGRGKSDPFATVLLNGRQVGKTKTLKKTLDPEWDEVFQVELKDASELYGGGANAATSWAESELVVRVFDYDLVGDNDFLGEVRFGQDRLLALLGLDPTSATSGTATNKTQRSPLDYTELALQELDGAPPPAKKKMAVRGTIHVGADLRVALKHADPIEEDKKKSKRAAKRREDSKPEALRMKEYFEAQLPLSASGKEAQEGFAALDQANINQWILTVNFDKAADIKKADRWGKSDPYVKVFVNDVAAGKSQTLSKTLNPVWNETDKELLITRKKHFGSGKTGKRPACWRNASLVFEIFDHDLVGMDDPIGRITFKGEELALFLATSTMIGVEASSGAFPLYERGDGTQRAKGTLSVTASLSPANNEAEEALQRELKRLEDLEARKVDAPWPVWMKLYDQEVHNYYFVNSATGESTYELPVPADSTFERESSRRARALPEQIAAGPPDAYLRHMSACKIQTRVARRRSARQRVRKKRGAKVLETNGGGTGQTWVECFDPLASRPYYWNTTEPTIPEEREIVWDVAPTELIDLRRQIIRSVDPQSRRYYYHTTPFTADTWAWDLPATFHPGGTSHKISAAIVIQSGYRSYFSRMARTSRRERARMVDVEAVVGGGSSPKARRRGRLRMKKKKSVATASADDADMTADERAQVVLTKAVTRLEGVIAAFELPYRHRESRRADRRKVLNRARTIIQMAVSMSEIAGNQIALARGSGTAAKKAPKSVAITTKGAGRTTKEIMNDEVAAFEDKVKQAAQALEGTVGIVAWYEVETVYRLKRLLEGLTALDIYHLIAPASEDHGATHTVLKDSIRKAEATMREFMNKLGKGFRKALRRWGRMMNEDCGMALAAMSTSELLPVDRSRDNMDAMHGDPLRYGRYYWLTVNKTRLMPFPVELGGLSYGRVQSYVDKIRKSVYKGLEHARAYLMLVGAERDQRIGREEVSPLVVL